MKKFGIYTYSSKEYRNLFTQFALFTFILFECSLYSVEFMLKNTGNECARQVLSISNMLFNFEFR